VPDKIQLSKVSNFWFDNIGSAVDGLILFNEELQIIKVSDPLIQKLNLEKDQIIGLMFSQIFPSLDASWLLNNANQFKEEAELQLSQGSIVLPVEITLLSLTDDPALHLISLNDLSERNSLKFELAKSHQQFDAVFTKAVDPIIIIDEKGIILKANLATVRQFGYSLDEIIGENISMFMPEPHRSRHDQYIANYLSSGKAKIIGIGREVQGRRKDESLFHMRLSVSEIHTEQGSVFTGTVQNLDDQKAAEAEIIKLNKVLEDKVKVRTHELTKTVNKLLSTNKKLELAVQQREKITAALKQSESELKEALSKEKELGNLKSRFVSMASHEFRTPLSSILSSAELVQMVLDKDKPEKAKNYLERIVNSVNTLTGILNDFLSLSRLEEGQHVIEFTDFNLEDLCQEIKKELKPLLKRGQSFELQHSNPELIVHSDRRILKNILTNLISNASKYSKENKPIACYVSNDDMNFSIAIEDQGMGIPAEDIPHLFSRFFRASNAVNIQGTGLGLNIIKRYLKILGGTIELQTALNEGSTFTVSLPIKKE